MRKFSLCNGVHCVSLKLCNPLCLHCGCVYTLHRHCHILMPCHLMWLSLRSLDYRFCPLIVFQKQHQCLGQGNITPLPHTSLDNRPLNTFHKASQNGNFNKCNISMLPSSSSNERPFNGIRHPKTQYAGSRLIGSSENARCNVMREVKKSQMNEYKHAELLLQAVIRY